MKHYKLYLIFVLFPFSLFGQTKTEQLKELFDLYYQQHKFQGTVLVAKGDSIIFEKAYGTAHMEWDIPNTIETKYRISSMTKQFTAYLTVQMIEAGKLKLDGKISDYLPNYRRDTGGKVTIHHLLNHRSGIPSISSCKEFRFDAMYKPNVLDTLILKWCSGDLKFEPGSDRNYSNSNYMLLGVILEQVSGKPWGELLQEKILDPLNMNNTGLADERKITYGLASGYVVNSEKGYDRERVAHYANLYAAGQLYSTTHDLWKFDRVLHDSNLLSEAMKTKMLTPDSNHYGLGRQLYVRLYPKQKDSVTTTWYGGGFEGFCSFSQSFIEDELYMVFLNNTNNMRVPKDLRGKISDNIINIMFDLPYDLPVQKTPVEIAPEILQQCLGVYQAEDGTYRIVGKKDDGIYYLRSDKPKKYLIFPESKSTFYFSFSHNLVLTFERSKKNKVINMHLHKPDNVSTFKKLSAKKGDKIYTKFFK
jgi:CubicO group peptidase (beta-lactamase class C family)